MNMEACVAAAKLPTYLTACADVDAWRGRCVRHFAKLEQAIARFLVTHDPQALAVGHGLGCRLNQLETFLAKAPPKTKSLRKRLAALKRHKPRRDAIVHGDGGIYLNERGDWLWDCEVLDSRDPSPRPEIVRMAEAVSFEKELECDVRGLCDGLVHYHPKAVSTDFATQPAP